MPTTYIPEKPPTLVTRATKAATNSIFSERVLLAVLAGLVSLAPLPYGPIGAALTVLVAVARRR